MNEPASGRRPVGTMVAFGFHERVLAVDIEIALRLGATLVEVLPDWRNLPDPAELVEQVAASGLAVHSVHGCWGGQAIEAPRVDLGSTSSSTHANSLDDLRRCVDWTNNADGRCLVVHPGGLSAPESAPARRDALQRGLSALADHAGPAGVTICVENMPPGVHPGSRMSDLSELVAELARPEVALALDTGHAHISLSAREETLAAGRLLRTTHVHDNNGRQDVHLPPGEGTLDWPSWADALDEVGYEGPVMLECIRHLRWNPGSLSDGLLALLDRLATRRPARSDG